MNASDRNEVGNKYNLLSPKTLCLMWEMYQGDLEAAFGRKDLSVAESFLQEESFCVITNLKPGTLMLTHLRP